MAIARSQPKADWLTYSDYLTEGYVPGRYDIVEGVRRKMPGPSWELQTIVGNLYAVLRDYGRSSQNGRAMLAPFDVLIRRTPRLQVRQPDIFFISEEALQSTEATLKSSILEAAPEIAVEVVSDSETEDRTAGKLRDYHEIGVRECWIVRPEAQTVEVLGRVPDGCRTEAVYSTDETVTSRAFPDLAVPMAAIFTK